MFYEKKSKFILYLSIYDNKKKRPDYVITLDYAAHVITDLN